MNIIPLSGTDCRRYFCKHPGCFRIFQEIHVIGTEQDFKQRNHEAMNFHPIGCLWYPQTMFWRISTNNTGKSIIPKNQYCFTFHETEKTPPAGNYKNRSRNLFKVSFLHSLLFSKHNVSPEQCFLTVKKTNLNYCLGFKALFSVAVVVLGGGGLKNTDPEMIYQTLVHTETTFPKFFFSPVSGSGHWLAF